MQKLSGVASVEVSEEDLDSDWLQVRYDAGTLKEQDLIQAVKDEGFDAVILAK